MPRPFTSPVTTTTSRKFLHQQVLERGQEVQFQLPVPLLFPLEKTQLWGYSGCSCQTPLGWMGAVPDPVAAAPGLALSEILGR